TMLLKGNAGAMDDRRMKTWRSRERPRIRLGSGGRCVGQVRPIVLDSFFRARRLGWTESPRQDDRTRDPAPDRDALVRALRSQPGGSDTWLRTQRREATSTKQSGECRAVMSYRSVREPAAFERANCMKVLSSYTLRVRDPRRGKPHGARPTGGEGHASQRMD